MRFATSLTALCVAIAISSTAQSATLKTLYSFCSASNCADGEEPSAALLRDSNGNLFGTTFYGGTAPGFQGGGVAFELSPGHGGKWKFSNLHTFCSQTSCADGDNPNSDLIVDTAGNLYGAAPGGGSLDHGVIYELSPDGTSWNYTDLHDFTGADGISPNGALRYVGFDTGAAYDGTSPLYGTTVIGGSGGGGTVFQLTPDAGSWTLTTIHSFSNNSNGYDPVQNLTLDASGTNLYGVLIEPLGAVFQLTDAGGGVWDETTIYSFGRTNGDDTYYPFSTLLLDASGSLIGTTSDGGPHCKYLRHHESKRCGGGVFKLSGGANPTFDAIHDFCADDKLCQDGNDPGGTLVMDPSGTIYGVTAGGGKYDGGTVFRIRRESKLEVIYDFCSRPNCSDGQLPQGGLTLDSKGHLYGVTAFGGANNEGTVFELTP